MRNSQLTQVLKLLKCTQGFDVGKSNDKEQCFYYSRSSGGLHCFCHDLKLEIASYHIRISSNQQRWSRDTSPRCSAENRSTLTNQNVTTHVFQNNSVKSCEWKCSFTYTLILIHTRQIDEGDILREPDDANECWNKILSLVNEVVSYDVFVVTIPVFRWQTVIQYRFLHSSENEK